MRSHLSLRGFLSLGLFCLAGQGDGECGTLAQLALGFDVATEHSAEPAADCESESCAAVFAGRRFICLSEWLEEPFQLGRLDADACV